MLASGIPAGQPMGAPNVTNAHPHMTDMVAVVHNGIIENFKPLRERLEKEGANLKRIRIQRSLFI